MTLFKKTLVLFFIFSLVVPYNFALALFPDPAEAMNQILSDLGVDKDELKKTLNDTVDVANFKKNPPAVTLSFIPASPVPGKELTAVATPAYFTGNPGSMYFTWYLKHEKCEKARKEERKYVAACNLNDDNKVDEEDWKIEAMKILARGNTEELFDYSSGDDDDDGYEASYGGDDQKDKPEHCYVRDIASGVDYEIGVPAEDPDDPTEMHCEHVFPEDVGGPDGNFGLKDEKFWGTDPHSKDTNNDGVPDEEALTGKGMMQIKWNFQKGDQIGVAVEGIQENTDYGDSSYKTMWAFSGGTCEIATPNIPPQSKDERNIYKFYNYHGCDFPDEVSVKVECSNTDVTYPKFINPKSYGISPTNCGGSTEKTDPQCSGGLAFLPCSAIKYSGDDCSRCYLDPSTFSLWKGGGGDGFLALVLDSSLGDATCEACIYNEGNDGPYYFPPGSETEKFVGDQVMCGEWKGKMSYEEANRPSSDTNLNDCLEDNLVDPAQGTADKKIEVSLSYDPQYPIIDPKGVNADELTIRANLSNIENKSFVKYIWSLWNCPDKTGTACTQLDKIALSPEKTKLLQTTGMGLDLLKMKLFMPAMTFLKIELQATEDTRQAVGKSGKGSIVIPMQKSEQTITPHAVNVLLDPSVEAGLRLELGDERNTACSGKTCPVVQNEIIGLNVDGISGYESAWSLNGKPLLASESKPGIVYFPILQSADFRYSVRLDLSKDKEKISLTRDFKVEDPSVMIKPEECNSNTGQACRPLFLGKFIDPTDPKNADLMIDDYSQDIFQSDKGSILTIHPSFNFDSSILRNAEKNNYNINWFVDRKLVDPTNTDPKLPQIDGENLKLPIEKEAGEKYIVSVEAIYTQSEINKRALNKLWNNPKNYFYATTVSDSAEIEVVKAPKQASSGTKKIIASLFSLMPDYVNFLFRIVLTMALILFSTRLLISVFPKQDRY